VLLDRKPLLVLATGVALFHFANAPMLPLLTQKLALAHAGAETVLVAACVVIAQLVSVPTALLVGARADSWGRKPLFLTAFSRRCRCAAFFIRCRTTLFFWSRCKPWTVSVSAFWTRS